MFLAHFANLDELFEDIDIHGHTHLSSYTRLFFMSKPTLSMYPSNLTSPVVLVAKGGFIFIITFFFFTSTFYESVKGVAVVRGDSHFAS